MNVGSLSEDTLQCRHCQAGARANAWLRRPNHHGGPAQCRPLSNHTQSPGQPLHHGFAAKFALRGAALAIHALWRAVDFSLGVVKLFPGRNNRQQGRETTMDLNAMLVFARVVEEKGFSAASRRLNMSKSAVSKQISQLEDRIGARLLNRTTRSLSLTDAGAAFFERCVRIVAEAEEAELAVSSMQSAPRGRLRLTAPMTFGARHVAPLVAEFMHKYEGLQVDVSLSDRVVDLIDEGFDLAVRVGRLADSSLIAKRLCSMPAYLVASPAYLAAQGTPRVPADLAQHNCLEYAYATVANTWTFQGEGGPHQVHVRGTMRANNGEVILAAVRAGIGVAVMPAVFAGAELCSGEVVEILREFRPQPGAVHAVYPHSRHLSAKVRLFVDDLAQAFATPPWAWPDS